MDKDMTTIDRINAMEAALDKLADAQGRARCGYIWALSNLVNALRKDVLNLEEQLMLKGSATGEEFKMEAPTESMN